jgi:peptide/nickel transport system ATP-binding protein
MVATATWSLPPPAPARPSSRRELIDSVEHGFGRLPPGCHIQLQRQTRDQVLRGLREMTTPNWRRLTTELQAHVALRGRTSVRLAEFLHDQALDPGEVYRASTGTALSGWTPLKRDAGLIAADPEPEEAYFSRRFADLLHVDDPLRLDLMATVSALSSAPVPLLEVSNLRVTLNTARGPADALRDVSFTLDRGDTVGLIGESGCGKSITALALMGLLPEGAKVSGSIRLDGQQLTALDEAGWCDLRGRRIGMVFQEPMTALNPLHTVGRQVAEPLRVHKGLSAAAARAEALRLLERVHLPQAARRLDAYPHQLSGGQRQRVVIAIALACGPDLLLADEPTTALDVTIQREVLDLIAELVAESRMALLLISHDLGVMARSVQRMLVMYGGTVVEDGPTAAVFARLAHPYTRALFAARPRLGLARGTRLATIPGRVPELADLPVGCAFADRCAHVVDACRAALPVPIAVGEAHHARCVRVHELAA